MDTSWLVSLSFAALVVVNYFSERAAFKRGTNQPSEEAKRKIIYDTQRTMADRYFGTWTCVEKHVCTDTMSSFFGLPPQPAVLLERFPERLMLLCDHEWVQVGTKVRLEVIKNNSEYYPNMSLSTMLVIEPDRPPTAAEMEQQEFQSLIGSMVVVDPNRPPPQVH